MTGEQRHIVPLPEHFRYLHQYPGGRASSGPAPDRSWSAALAMLLQINAPGRWIPEEVEARLYEHIAAAVHPWAAVISWLQEQSVAYVELPSEETMNSDGLRQILQHQNRLGIPQLVVVSESNALHTIDGRLVHSWINQQHPGSHHALVRIGYSEGDGAGLYFDPGAPAFDQPVPLSWQDSILPAGMVACLAIMPAGVAQPPADWDWLNRDWPEKVPQPNLAAIQQTIADAQAELEQHEATVKAKLAAVLAEASKGGHA